MTISSFFDNKLIVTAMLAVAIVLLVVIIRIMIHRRKIDIRKISLSNKWVDNTFDKYALKVTKHSFQKEGKPIETQKGEYRADFTKAWEKEYSRITQECCDGKKMCADLCSFVDENYPSPRAKDLYKIIKGYLKFRRVSIQKNYDHFLSQFDSISPDEFFEIKPLQKGDVVGVYVIHNETKDMYYVGQAKKLFFRVNQHFTGHGNGDVYADYKYGDDFSIKIIKLTDSGYSDLDLLEKHLIEKYDAYNFGYNKTSGNR